MKHPKCRLPGFLSFGGAPLFKAGEKLRVAESVGYRPPVFFPRGRFGGWSLEQGLGTHFEEIGKHDA